eukprot:6012275-Amphidinium_carterae.1
MEDGPFLDPRQLPQMPEPQSQPSVIAEGADVGHPVLPTIDQAMSSAPSVMPESRPEPSLEVALRLRFVNECINRTGFFQQFFPRVELVECVHVRGTVSPLIHLDDTGVVQKEITKDIIRCHISGLSYEYKDDTSLKDVFGHTVTHTGRRVHDLDFNADFYDAESAAAPPHPLGHYQPPP